MSRAPRLLLAILALASQACGGDSDAPAGSGGAPAISGAGGHAGSLDGGTDGDAAPVLVDGLYAEYFDAYHDLVASRVEPTLDADWMDGAPADGVGADRFSARWSGFLVAPTSGAYTLISDTDDGVRVFVDDALVIDDWHGHFITRNQAPVTLEAGKPAKLRVEYFEIDLSASARLSWSSDASAEEVVPTSALRTYAQPTGLVAPKPPYTNPVVPFDCPDPGVLATPEAAPPGYVMVCTGGSFPIRRSRDLVFWSDAGSSLLPNGAPAWAANGFRNWAPEIHRVGSSYVAYFTSVNGADQLSVGAVSSSDVFGPYVEGPAPLVQDPVGVIDPTYFEDDDGKRWLLYKIDGNSIGQPTPIFTRELSADGLGFQAGSSPILLLSNDPASWEGGVVEAPFVVKHDGTYFLFYSGNVYDHRYRTGVARASSITGPYEKHGGPILGNNERWVGPGHGSVVHASDTDYFVYHAWSNAGDGTQDGAKGRQVLVDAIRWEGGWPAISDGTPSRSPQPWPAADLP